MNGEILGNRYELLEQIGEGGMAIVYKARCNKLNRFVAVKILKDEYSDNEEIVNKFKKEATAIAKLSDNNIVNVLDVGTEGARNYIVMEFVDGKTLKEVIEEFGKINYETAITIAIQVAKALDCAHKNNIVHRDIKPQNILVTENGLIKVTDFGIAKSSDSATLTNTSTILGSAHYFSPEQARGGFIDNRTDIYSLGIVMYEMLTGKLPFEADSPVTIALKHLQEDVIPPKNINSKIPESLNKVVVKCMEKDPNKRYQDIKELISDLEKIKENPDAEILAPIDDGAVSQDTAQHTIVMSPIKEPLDDNVIDDYEDDPLDDYYEDDEYYDDYDDEDEEEKPKNKKQKKKGKGVIIGIIAAIVILLLGSGAYFLLSGEKDKNVEVPNLVGMSLEDAEKAAEQVGLKVVKVAETKSNEKEGTVIDTNPKSGTSVKEGTTIEVTVSGGEKIILPDLTEDTLSDAKAKLSSLGLTNIRVVEEYSDNIPQNSVISQDPKDGTEVQKDTTITLTISKGKEIKTVKVPSVSGLSESEAREKLSAVGLKVNVETTNTTDESLKDKVVSQSPSANSSVKEGTTVTIQIGNFKENISIDSIISTDMTGTEAVAALKSKGITNVTIEGNGSDRVASWTPNNISSKEEKITVTTKKDKVGLGNYINTNMTGNEAKNALASQGFTNVNIKGNGEWTVVGWTPDSAAHGDKITITTKKTEEEPSDDKEVTTNKDENKNNKEAK